MTEPEKQLNRISEIGRLFSDEEIDEILKKSRITRDFDRLTGQITYSISTPVLKNGCAAHAKSVTRKEILHELKGKFGLRFALRLIRNELKATVGKYLEKA